MNGSRVWGREIRYDKWHINPVDLEAMRKDADEVSDEALSNMDSMKEILDLCTSAAADKCNIDRLNPPVKSFVENVLRTPEWIDFDKVARGQRVFLRHFASAGLGLLYFSLIGGFSAPKIVKVLSSTSYLTENEARTWKRLNETFEMVVDCVCDDDAMRVGGKGWCSVLRVRLLHSHVRAMLLGRKGSNSWDSELYGLPINQEDMLATLMAFSINVLDSIEKIEGPFSLSVQDKENYLHLWRTIGYYIGVKEEHNKCIHVNLAYGTVESIVLHLLYPDATSGIVARHVLRSVSRRPPHFFSYETHCQAARYLLDAPLANALGIQFSFLHWIYITFVFLMIKIYNILVDPLLHRYDEKHLMRIRYILRAVVNKALLKSS